MSDVSENTIVETERLSLREVVAEDAEFVLDLLNQPSFKKFIGDRGVRTLEQAQEYISTRFTESYRTNGFGLYLMELSDSAQPIGICGFVRREALPHPDIGFALLPRYEKQGYAYEASAAIMQYGREKLGLGRVLAITTVDNFSSGRLLEKIGLRFEREVEMNGETLKLYSTESEV
jgi:RimJ/RimL family protein N-acetyltransferase